MLQSLEKSGNGKIFGDYIVDTAAVPTCLARPRKIPKRTPPLRGGPLRCAESGIPGFDVRAWQGLVGPAGLPEPIVSRLNTEVVRILKDPTTTERMHTFGNEPAPTTPEEFRKRLTDDIALWTSVAEQIHFEKI